MHIANVLTAKLRIKIVRKDIPTRRNVRGIPTVGWIKMPLGKKVGLDPGHIVLYGDPVGTQAPQQPLPTSAHVYCGQTVARLSNC